MMLDDIAFYLSSHGIGTVGVNIFEGARPPTPNQLVALYQYAGEVPALIRGIKMEYPGLQVWSRATTEPLAITLLDSVVDALHGLTEYSTAYARYLCIEARSSPMDMGADANGRLEYVVNFRVIMARL